METIWECQMRSWLLWITGFNQGIISRLLLNIKGKKRIHELSLNVWHQIRYWQSIICLINWYVKNGRPNLKEDTSILGLMIDGGDLLTGYWNSARFSQLWFLVVKSPISVIRFAKSLSCFKGMKIISSCLITRLYKIFKILCSIEISLLLNYVFISQLSMVFQDITDQGQVFLLLKWWWCSGYSYEWVYQFNE